jgi:hypothetical protein
VLSPALADVIKPASAAAAAAAIINVFIVVLSLSEAISHRIACRVSKGA